MLLTQLLFPSFQVVT